MLEVAVIGAGAAGLVASRHLLGQGLRPSIFDAAKTVGGAWSTASSSSSSSSSTKTEEDHQSSSAAAASSPSKMWNGLHTNLSKHTCRFSEWPWPADVPAFPSAIDMNQYLESYATEFVDPTCFQFQCKVTNIISQQQQQQQQLQSDDGNGDAAAVSYRVEWIDLTSQTKHSKDFEGVIVATGFFSKPYLPDGLFESLVNRDDDDDTMTTILHSGDYVSADDFANESVAVIGNSFSALEIAVDISQTAKRVVNVLPSVPWVVPRYVFPPPPKSTTSTTSSQSPSAPTPLDMAYYRRTQPAPQLPERVPPTASDHRAKHEYLKSLLQLKQQHLPLGIPTDFEKPPILAISDSYLDLVADEQIEIVHGRLASVDDTTGSLTIVGDNDKSQQQIIVDGITKVICCTGYKPDLEEYVDESILKTIEYDPNDKFAPMTLCWETLHPSLQNFAFCGMYKGPNMGHMELQGRLAAGVMSGSIVLDDNGGDDDNNNNEENTMQKALEISRQIRTTTPRPPFPRGDYVGFLDTLADVVSRKNSGGGNNGEANSSCLPKICTNPGDMVSPAFYQDDLELAERERAEMESIVENGMDNLAGLVVSAMIGKWKYHRNIHHLSQNRMESVHGTIRYSLPTLDVCKYREDGFYEYAPGKVMDVFREYEYVVTPAGILEIYFVEGGQRAHLFLSLKFTEQDERGYWVATSDHLCIKDLYKGTFQVKLDGLAAIEIIITYRVRGPAKDYESTTILTPLR